MKRRSSLGLVGLLGLVGGVRAETIKINEIVTEPQTDWNDNGAITDIDEFVELYNPNSFPVNVEGYLLVMTDTTPSVQELSGIIPPRSYLVEQNPAGNINNNVMIEIYNLENALEDSVTLGNWDDGNVEDNAPSGNSVGTFDESISYFNENWINTYGTPGAPNVPELPTWVVLGAGSLALVTRRSIREERYLF